MEKKNSTFYQLNRTDKIIFASFFLIFPALTLLDSNDEGEDALSEYLLWVVLTADAIVIIYFSVFKWLKKFKGKGHYLILFLKATILSSLLIFTELMIHLFIFGVDQSQDEDSGLSVFITMLFILLILSTILLGIIMLKKGVDAQVQVFKFENLQKSNELQLLKSQIDPHFLFNNLNTLDALVDTDMEKVKPFIQRLAKLYHYLLATMDEDTICLEREMNFANDYIYLIQERFSDNYQFKIINNRKDKVAKFIPPGAIQTVFENIIKHNNASKQHPIKTEIIINDHQIVISNNIRSKEEPIESFGIGLSNLQSRYEILSNLRISIQIDDFYTITLPLIQTVIN